MIPSRLSTPEHWVARLSAPPELSSDPAVWPGGLVRRWRGVEALMEQPALDHHQIALHLGGPKRIHRGGDGGTLSADVALNALTFTSAGRRHRWTTEGPIEFAHLYVRPRRLEAIAAEEFGREGVSVQLSNALGRADPFLASVIIEMLAELQRLGSGSRLYLDTLMNLALVKLLRDHSTLETRASGAHLLSPPRLRRVLDFIEAGLHAEIALDDLARVAGASPYRFGQAFRRATGGSPYAYVLDQRIERASRLLRESDATVAAVAAACGFNSPTQFSTIFKRRTGVSPRRFRQDW